MSLKRHTAGSSIADLDLQGFLGEGPDFLLPLELQPSMLAFLSQTDILGSSPLPLVVPPSDFMDRGACAAPQPS